VQVEVEVRTLCLIKVYGSNSSALYLDFVREISDALRGVKICESHDPFGRLQCTYWERCRGMEACD